MFLLMTIDFGAPGLPADSAQHHEIEEDEIQRLVVRARQGDRAAAGRLYRVLARRVFRAVRPLCGNEAEAEEVLQETFVKAFTSLRRYQRRGQTRFVSWLLRIAMNTARTRLRQGHLAPQVMEPDTLDQVAGADMENEEHHFFELQRKALFAALAELKPRDREIVMLFYGAGLTAAEVGEVSKVREANVRKICQRQKKQILHRVRELLRQYEQDSSSLGRGSDEYGPFENASAEERP